MYGFIGAMEMETDGLVEKMTDARSVTAGAYSFTVGKLAGRDAVVCRCGIGKVFSSTAAALMIDKFAPDLIINLGVAGGKKPLRRGDLVIAERTVQHDYDATADGLEPGRVHGFESPYFGCDAGLCEGLRKALSELGYRYATGTIASGDCFVSDEAKSAAIAERFGACAFDMESAAINQVCAVQSVPFTALRAISDNADDGAVQSFYEFAREASARSIETVALFVEKYAEK